MKNSVCKNGTLGSFNSKIFKELDSEAIHVSMDKHLQS